MVERNEATFVERLVALKNQNRCYHYFKMNEQYKAFFTVLYMKCIQFLFFAIQHGGLKALSHCFGKSNLTWILNYLRFWV